MVYLIAQPSSNREDGFTLLEVLIAVSILTLVLIGAMQLSQQRIRTTSHVEEKLAASQVIGNLLHEYRLQGSPVEPSESEGDVAMGDWQFHWLRKVSTSESNRRHRIEMQVFIEDDLIQDRIWYKAQ